VLGSTIAACTALALALVLPSSSAHVNAWRLGDCQAVGKQGATKYVLCFRPNRNEHGVFLARRGGTVHRLDIRPPGATASAADAGRVGHWAWAALSPDGRMFVAEWSAECEVPTGFFVRTGSPPRPVTGERDWAKSPESSVFGWTTDRRAIVRLPKSICGSTGPAGLYLISPGGARKRIAGLALHPKRSLTARPVAALLGP
jgi:hypothetical protein